MADSHSSNYIPMLTPEFVARSLGTPTPGNPARAKQPFTFVTSDSRQVRPGCLFVAIKGEKMDGHDFVDAAISQGARGVIVKRGTPLKDAKDVCVFPTDQTLTAYRKLAALWRKEFSIPFVVVAGSVGKTTTKEILAALCQGKWNHVHKTTGSQNGYVGIPMTLLDLKPEHSVAIIEVGIDEPGAMAQHIDLVHPTHAVLTAIAEEHLEKLGDIPTVAREEGEALKLTANLGGTVLVQMDDPWIRPHLQTLRMGHKIAFGIEPREGLQISGTLNAEQTALHVHGPGMDLSFPLPLPGPHNARNLLAAIAVAHTLGLTAAEMLKGLTRFQGAQGRSELKELHGTTVICDYYNASPASMHAALQLLAAQKSRTARTACLGDMLELGEGELEYHRALAATLQDLKINQVYLYGPRMVALRDELEKRSFSGDFKHFESHSELAQTLTQTAKPGDPILIKGSRSMRMEEVWKIFEPYAKTHWK